MPYKTTLLIKPKNFLHGVFLTSEQKNSYLAILDSEPCSRTILTNDGKQFISLPKHSLILSYYKKDDNEKIFLAGVSLGQIEIINNEVNLKLFNINSGFTGYCGMRYWFDLSKQPNQYDNIINVFWNSYFPYSKYSDPKSLFSTNINITSIFRKQDLQKVIEIYNANRNS